LLLSFFVFSNDRFRVGFSPGAAKTFGDFMPIEPAQIALALFELCLFAGGVGLAIWLLGNPGARSRWLATNALPPTPWGLSDFLLSGALILLTGFFFQAIAQLSVGSMIGQATDHQGLALFVYSVANYAGALLAWKAMFPSLRRSWVLKSATPWPEPPAALPWSRALRYGAGCLAIGLPVLSLISLGWNIVIEKLDLPVAPQDVVAIFTSAKSPFVIAGMLLVACVFAPLYEELIFRAGIFRFGRQNPDGVPTLLAVPFFMGASVVCYQVLNPIFAHQPSKWGPEFLLAAIALAGAGVMIFKLSRKSAFIEHRRRAFSILLSGFYFGLLHGNWAGFLPLAILGMGLAIAYEATGSIRVSIIAHGLFNLNTILVLLSGLPEVAKQ
jgi:membrane protease YdiL (CAAX protease family)